MKSLEIFRSIVGEKGWQCSEESREGERAHQAGQMFWKGTLNRIIQLPDGEALIYIQARADQADDIWPYMVVELEGEEIGATFVDSPGWRDYSFSVNTKGGFKVLSASFVNDGTNEKKLEDRNLYLGMVAIGEQDGTK